MDGAFRKYPVNIYLFKVTIETLEKDVKHVHNKTQR